MKYFTDISLGILAELSVEDIYHFQTYLESYSTSDMGDHVSCISDFFARRKKPECGKPR